MIRAFPKSFAYPVPRGWLYPTLTMPPATAYDWNEYPELRERYRGFRTAMRTLAKEPNSVSELVITSIFRLGLTAQYLTSLVKSTIILLLC